MPSIYNHIAKSLLLGSILVGSYSNHLDLF